MTFWEIDRLTHSGRMLALLVGHLTNHKLMCLVGVLVYIPNVDLQVLGLQNDDIFSGGVALEGLS